MLHQWLRSRDSQPASAASGVPCAEGWPTQVAPLFLISTHFKPRGFQAADLRTASENSLVGRQRRGSFHFPHSLLPHPAEDSPGDNVCVPCQEAERKSRAEKAREPSRSGVQAIGCGCGRVRKALRLGWSWGGSHCSTPKPIYTFQEERKPQSSTPVL